MWVQMKGETETETFCFFLQSKPSSLECSSPSACLTSPSRLPRVKATSPCDRHENIEHNMTQSCPTPPQSRRRFFLSPKSLRAPWGLVSKLSHSPAENTDSPLTMSGKVLLPSTWTWDRIVRSGSENNFPLMSHPSFPLKWDTFFISKCSI